MLDRSRLHLRIGAIALMTSVVVLVAGYLFLAAGGGVFSSTRPIQFKPDGSSVVRGKSLERGSLWAPSADSDGILIIRLSESTIDAESFPTLNIDALADTTPLAASLLWRQTDGARLTFIKTIAWRSSGHERLALAGDAQWRGQVTGLAIAFKLQPDSAVLFRSATLQPDTGRSIVSQIVREWLDPEPWSLYSVNFLYGGSPNPRLPLVPTIFVIAAVAFWIYRVFAKRNGLTPSWLVAAALAIGAWAVIDARWQYNLLANLSITAEKYAGKSAAEKHLAAEDANIYRVAEKIRAGLPAGITKVTLVSDLADSKLFVGKLRYYLFPLALQPTPEPLDSGSVLAVVQSAGSKFNLSSGTLQLSEGPILNVVTLVDDPMVRLVRMR